jgi:hypothetical protein
MKITTRGKKAVSIATIFLATTGGAGYFVSTINSPRDVLQEVNQSIDNKIAAIQGIERLRNECTNLPEKINAFMSGIDVSTRITSSYATPNEERGEYGFCTLNINNTGTWGISFPDGFTMPHNQTKFTNHLADQITSADDLKKFRANTQAFLEIFKPAP